MINEPHWLWVCGLCISASLVLSNFKFIAAKNHLRGTYGIGDFTFFLIKATYIKNWPREEMDSNILRDHGRNFIMYLVTFIHWFISSSSSRNRRIRRTPTRNTTISKFVVQASPLEMCKYLLAIWQCSVSTKNVC